MMDAYDIANAIMTMWQRTSIGFNDATQIKKQYKHVPILIKVNDDFIKVTGVQLDNSRGIILHTEDKDE